MPRITALIHTHNHARSIGRALDSLRPCDEVLVVDHGSDDDTLKVARQHGATVKKGIPGVEPGAYAADTLYPWVFCLRPTEALSESLEAALYEWKHSDPPEEAVGYALSVREETADGWQLSLPELRLVNRDKSKWHDTLPANQDGVEVLVGDLLRFRP